MIKIDDVDLLMMVLLMMMMIVFNELDVVHDDEYEMVVMFVDQEMMDVDYYNVINRV